MNNKHRNTLKQIFATPIRPDIRWPDIISLFEALGARIIQGAGSRIGVLLNDCFYVFHEPHPGNIAKKAVVKAVRDFLEKAGIHSHEI